MSTLATRARTEPVHVFRSAIPLAFLLCLVCLIAIACRPASADEVSTAPPATAEAPVKKLQFSFEGTPWRSVLDWLAEEADLAIHVGDLPSGSFTYTDSSSFSPDEAIDRVNLFLIPQGFTLVRRGKLLSVISLTDAKSRQQLDAMAELVTADQLDQHEPYEVVKCLFRLDKTPPDVASEELRSLTLMSEPVILPSSRQLMIVGTVRKLRSVQAILSALEEPTHDESVVKRFKLEHCTLDEVMTVARTHLGLMEGETAGIDINISATDDGKTLFVTGVEAKVELLSGLIDVVDVPDAAAIAISPQTLVSHEIKGNNLRTVYEVLQTLMVGKQIRLSMEADSNSIVALCDETTHEQIRSTIKELEVPPVEFAVIDLGDVDPYFAITLIEELFDLPSEFAEDEDEDSEAPKVDADPENRRLFVRGKRFQVDQIRELVDGLKTNRTQQVTTRLVPIHGNDAGISLQSARELWNATNPVRVLPPTGAGQGGFLERTVFPDQSAVTKPASSAGNRGEQPQSDPGTEQAPAGQAPRSRSNAPADASDDGFANIRDESPKLSLASTINETVDSSPPILSRVTGQGIILESADSAALEQFDSHLRRVAGLGDQSVQPVVYYLKYAEANQATRMLGELIDGAMTITGSASGSLVNGYVSSPTEGDLLGAFVLDRNGAATMTVGTASVLADVRLNRLIVQGSSSEIAMIERYLKIIDKDSSLTEIETYGTSHVIELQHSKAEEVAAMIREAFAGRISASKSATATAGSAQAAAKAKATANDARDSKSKSAKEQAPKQASKAAAPTPQMTVAVHPRSNTLVVTAPDHLIDQVKKLVEIVDARGEQTVTVIAPENAEYIQSVLEGVLLEQESTTSSRSRTKR